MAGVDARELFCVTWISYTADAAADIEVKKKKTKIVEVKTIEHNFSLFVIYSPQYDLSNL